MKKFFSKVLALIILGFRVVYVLVFVNRVAFFMNSTTESISFFTSNFDRISSVCYTSAYSFIYEIPDVGKFITYADSIMAGQLLTRLSHNNITITFGYFYNPSFIMTCCLFAYILDKVIVSIYDNLTIEGESHYSQVGLSDVVGLKDIKDEIQEILSIYDDSDFTRRLNPKKPKGILFFGPPGNGKTMIAKGIAKEFKGGFLAVSGSEFIEMYVGLGASRVRDLFGKARKFKKAVIFIDEIDAIAKRRGIDRNSERDATLNQLLVEMDGINSSEDIVVIGATNNVEDFDPAILRRFEMQIEFTNPGVLESQELLSILLRDVPAENLNIPYIASGLDSISRSKICTIVENAKRIACMNKRSIINMDDIDESILRMSMGKRKHNIKMSSRERWKTAYHEAGHAFLFYYYYKKGVFLHAPRYLTIVPRAHALGFVAYPNADDYQSHTASYINASIQVGYAGMLCEKFFQGEDETSTGCSSDLAQIRRYAESYVNFGLDDDVGGVGITQNKQSNAEMDSKYARIKELCQNNMIECERIINNNQHKIKRVGKEAYMCEIISKERLEQLMEIEREIDYRLCVIKPGM